MINIFTDGSCYVKTQQGGWGVYIIHEDGKEQFLSNGENNTTISRMEMTAILQALRSIKDKNKEVIIYSDSEFVIKSLTIGWLERWQKERFVNTKNSDLWLQIVEEKAKFTNLTFKHLRGHGKDLSDFLVYGNSVADALASWRNFVLAE